ncbi:MAG: toll/interleukin-1 receptor domain-containing protein [Verrucomicrobiota bacterium]
MKIFLGYSWEDRDVLDQLLPRLQHFDCWYDVERVRPGDDLSKVIEEALKGAGVLLFLWSAAADGSRWVRKEVSYFQGLEDSFTSDRMVIPVCLDKTPPPLLCSDLLKVHVANRTITEENWETIEEQLMENALLI